jgi:hypothetical protein
MAAPYRSASHQLVCPTGREDYAEHADRLRVAPHQMLAPLAQPMRPIPFEGSGVDRLGVQASLPARLPMCQARQKSQR